MEKGKVLFFDTSKGYGFITPGEDGRDIFVHHTGLNEDIDKDDVVEYEIETGEKGAFAVNVSVVK